MLSRCRNAYLGACVRKLYALIKAVCYLLKVLSLGYNHVHKMRLLVMQIVLL